MAARTEGDLEDALDSSLAWRRIELAALKGEIERLARTSPEAPLTRALVRSGTALLYAHWEGYVKEICQHYLDFVAVRKLRYSELNDGLALSALKDILRKMDNGDEAAARSVVEIVRSPTTARPSMPRKNIVNTKANLRFEVLREVLGRLGLPVDFFTTKENFIDKSLCDARNEIAHGRDHYPEPTGFESTLSDTLEMMEHTRALVLQHARSKGYRAN